MLKILIYLLIGASGVASLKRPWVGVVAAYTVVVLAPQSIWFWAFGDIRPFMYVAVPAMLGAVLGLASKKLSFAPLKDTIPRLVLVWWVCLIVSYYFGDFTHHPGPPRFFKADDVLGAMNKTFVFFLVALVCVRTDWAFRWLCAVILVAVIYHVYWANDIYLSGQSHQYGSAGRLGGPFDLALTGPYRDENNFGMLFVMGLPFVVYFALYLKRLIYRWALLAVVPLGWHAIFLTGSRGALLGLGVTLAVIVYRSRRRTLGLLLIPVFAAAYVWQGGSILKGRVEGIQEAPTETSAAGRLTAWTAASRMIADNPITGIGIASFGPAFPVYSTEQPREAHNTFFQLSAESGLIAGGAWVAICLAIILGFARRPRESLFGIENDDERFAAAMREAVLVSFCGYFVVALFLSLQANEAFIYLLVVATYLRLRHAAVASTETTIHSADQLRRGDRPMSRPSLRADSA